MSFGTRISDYIYNRVRWWLCSRGRSADTGTAMVKEVITHVVRRWRQLVPWRLSEMLALMLLTVTVFLFVHTNDLAAQLESAKQQQQRLALTGARSDGQSRDHRSPLALRADASSASGGGVRYKFQQTAPQFHFGQLNITGNAGKETLFFNRVPKVGSQSTMQLLKRLSYRNRFNFHKDHPQKVELINLNPPQEKRLCSLINIFRPPAVYVKHVCFLDFVKFTVIEASVSAINDRLEEPNAGRRHVAQPEQAIEPTEPVSTEGFDFGSYSDLQAELKTVREGVAKIKLPQDLVVGDSRAGVGKNDLPRFQVIQRYGYDPPIYFNMVRDPVERIISWYYYVRAPWYFVERKRAFPELELPDPNWLKKDYATCVEAGHAECSYEQGSVREDYGQLTEFFCGMERECTITKQCVLSNDWECRYIEGDKKDRVGDHRRMTGFFCGMEEDCSAFNSEVAMQKAKRNVEKYYAVVGVLEEMNKTLTVLEHYIPRFFAGASDIYQEEKRLSNVNKNSYKPPVAEYVKDIVRKNFTHEIEFYEFCKAAAAPAISRAGPAGKLTAACRRSSLTTGARRHDRPGQHSVSVCTCRCLEALGGRSGCDSARSNRRRSPQTARENAIGL
ncbi:Heparan sulfate 2-O-sulfotransferase pipe [Amphibalanus amphitrite]|uniref:Heparan sulfate 2-O-sulfotransferase pipe n=1 Tax=Amphibalanus amphitrite TaxID=1232801 RepID=A0A6A4VZG5_AMPAM|nr:Heparan sulfate 2-O-sulfotransferase pipe [Amphibalanus amphitrite]